MRIVIVGGGPAGLYAGILLKRLDSASDVTVVERNAPGQTFGFGVVFSDQTLANLRDADPRTRQQITEAFARWDAIDIRYRGSTIRCGGNGFSGIARRRLLDILCRRAEELGVALRFSAEHSWSPDDAAADLVIAADGVNSRTRERFAAEFGPRLETSSAKYIWLGTDKAFEAFTFSFRQNDDGCFQLHAYPYDAASSTFIVECDEASWRQAGLDRADEASSIAYCEELFAADLGGARLVPNASRWISFVTVHNRTWHAGNVVLLGDAAHTAHFSIGSGTKLAMEDAISLANAIAERPTLESALAFYESERRPVVERTQDAAAESRTWFETYGRYLGFAPPQFAFSLLARAGRVTHESLWRRDQRFVGGFDRWFAARAPGAPGAPEGAIPEVAPSPAFTRVGVGPVTLANRIVSAPVPDDAAVEGRPSDAWLRTLRTAGTGGAAVVLAELVAVAPEARVTTGCAGIWNDEQERCWGELAGALSGGTLLGLQLVHAGPRGSTRPRRCGTDWPLRGGGWPLVAASPVPFTPQSPVPAELDRAGMEAVVAQFAEAARRSAEAGAGVLEINAGHGYLLASFLSPLTNHRTDACGGDLAGRLRFPLEVVSAVRAVWPEDRVLAVRFSASDWAPGGTTEDEAAAIGAAFAEAGADLLDVVAGQTTGGARPEYGRGVYARVADVVRNATGVPTMTSGGLASPADADTLLAAGRADLCVIGRPALREPAWLASSSPAENRKETL